MKIVSGSSNQPFAHNLAESLGVPLVDVELSQFDNGEKRVFIKEPVRGERVVIVQSFSDPVDEHIIEFLLIADALERQGAEQAILVCPWMGYSMQDKVFREGEPIAAKVVANLISHSFVSRVYLTDLHNSSIPGFFSIPTYHLSAQPLFEDFVKEELELSEAIVASPDFGGLKRARRFAQSLDLELARIEKKRNLETGEVTAISLQGDVKNKTVVMIDDVILSGSTAAETSKLIKKQGAKKVVFMATHPMLVPGSGTNLNSQAIDQIVVTNTIDHQNLAEKYTLLDAADLFAAELKVWM